MLRTILTTSVCGLALLAPGALVSTASATADQPAARAASSITGTWKGKVVGDAGSAGAYPAKVKITRKNGKLRATIVYPGHCRGAWKLTGKKQGWTTFRETIRTGPCVDPVQVKVKRSGARLKVVWREPLTGDQATMLAKRK
ncbi:hypothetical protein [Nocardioides sp. W7]|uniref:hypothetical protein n=1 Tax=Nocardioides sp. W7 TaxID=2931390 RepID=UPI001FD0DA92|nr:hypothetical protein [Nocardioides sp. W7]